MNQKPMIILTGPTAVGKSALSVELAKKINGAVISADSMQVYRRMDIGTAKPDAHERALAAHHLIDVLDPASAGADLADYTAMCADAIADIAGRGAVPILCGGTGLYIDTLISGTVLSDSASSPELRAVHIPCGTLDTKAMEHRSIGLAVLIASVHNVARPVLCPDLV